MNDAICKIAIHFCNFLLLIVVSKSGFRFNPMHVHDPCPAAASLLSLCRYPTASATSSGLLSAAPKVGPALGTLPLPQRTGA